MKLLLLMLFLFPSLAVAARDEGIIVKEPVELVVTKEPTPQEILKELSITHGVSYEFAYQIIDCESERDVYAKNKSSTAKGLGQFVNGTWKSSSNRYLGYHGDIFDPREHLTVFVLKLKNEGYMARKDCVK